MLQQLPKKHPYYGGAAKSVGRTTIKYSGTIKLGVDGNSIKSKIEANTIKISLPPIKILSHEQNNIEVVGEKDGYFSKIEGNDYYLMLPQVKDKEEQLLMHSDNPQKTKNNLEKQIRNFLNTLPGIDEYIISIE